MRRAGRGEHVVGRALNASTGVGDGVAGLPTEVLDGLVEGMFHPRCASQVLGPMRRVASMRVVDHPSHDLGEVAGCAGHTFCGSSQRGRSFEHDHLNGPVHLTGQRHEAADRIVDVRYRGVSAEQIKDAVHGDVPGVQGAEVDGAGVTPLLTVPLLLLRFRLRASGDESSAQRRQGADGRAQDRRET